MHIEGKLKAALKKLQEVKVSDTSGGCGTMFNLQIIAEEFRYVVAGLPKLEGWSSPNDCSLLQVEVICRGKSIVKQHKMVTEILQDDIKDWHGFTLDTRVPKASQGDAAQ